MDKYEYKVRSGEITNLINEKKYAEAVQIADTIDWRRVKSSTMLLKISALYRVNKRNEDSRDILLLAYDRYPTNRSVVYSLCEVSIELNDIVAAIEFYKHFVKIAPDDSGVYTLRYRILETQEASLEERIAILEELKVKDYDPEWVYELAYLYHRAGLVTKCVETCDEIILWIGDGPYVMKAMELKALHVPLTEDQQARYNFMSGNATENYNAEGYDDDEDQPADGYYDEDGNFVVYDEEPADGYYDEDGNFVAYEEEEPADGYYDEDGNFVAYEEEEPADGYYDEDGNFVAYEYEGELADGYYDEDGNFVAYEQEEDSYQEDFYQENLYDENGNLVEAVEDNVEEPEQKQNDYNNVDMSQYNTINLQKVVAESMKELFPDDDVFAEEREKLNHEEDQDSIEKSNTIIYGRFKNEPVDNINDNNNIDIEEEQDNEAEGPLNDNTPMTGQMNIDDVLAEWEHMKEDNAKRHEEEIRNQILSQTGQMFADFDSSVNNDIMSKLDDSSKVTVKGGSIVMKPEETEDNLDIPEIDELEEPEEVKDEPVAMEEKDEAEELTDLEKAVADELGGTTQNIPYETIEEIVENDDEADEKYYEDNPYAEIETPDYKIEAEDSSDENQDLEIYNTTNLGHIQKEAYEALIVENENVLNNADDELDEEEEKDIVETAKEDALKTQEIKMNTADLSVLSEKIVETTNKEATGAQREEIRDFTEDEQELFENFAVTKKIKKQIINALDNMSLAAYTGNVIITGDAGLDTIRMAKNLIKEYQEQDTNFSGKIAKITGEKINSRDIKEIFEKLDNGGIIIEKANGMSEEKLYEMATLLNQENLGIIVILEDTKKEITKLLEKQAMVADYFNLRIDLMEMDNNALVAYAKNYALALEYAVDELGTLALYTRIANMQSGNHVVTKDEVRDIIDEAIYKSKKSKIKNFVDVLFARRYDSEDMIVLKERDFI